MVAVGARSLPQSEASAERVRVFARPATGRQLFQLVNVASPEDHIVGFEGSKQACDNVLDVMPPFLFPYTLQPPDPYVVLVRALSVGKMAQLHRLDDAVHDHGGPEAGPQSQEEHLSPLVAPQGLHGRVVDELDGIPKRGLKVETDPAGREVMWFRNRLASENRARIADRHHVVFPSLGSFRDARDHLFSRQG
jgi:hypothetical protein